MNDVTLHIGPYALDSIITGDAHKPKALARMHYLHGCSDGNSCGECRFLRTVQMNKAYFKCANFGVSAGPSTDWRKKWQACGLFEAQNGVE